MGQTATGGCGQGVQGPSRASGEDSMQQVAQVPDDLVARLRALIGETEVLDDAASCALYAQDVYSRAQPAIAVVRPGSTEELAQVVRTVVAMGCDVLARGGGMSYTGGYVPRSERAVIIDMQRMNRVIELNREDMFVTVECGCTWAELHRALEGTGLRTPYWGTLSGLKATIGGGLSQNAVFWGSGQFGSAVDSLLSLDVVLADGSVLSTGSAAQRNAKPFFRHFGPDLSGLFTSDTGALGIKARATLRLLPELPAREYLAFDFGSAAQTIAAMSEISRRNLAAECFGFDPFLQRQRMKRASLGADVKALAGVMKASGSVLGALKAGAQVALAGRSYMDEVDYSVQVIIEDRIPAAAAARAAEVRELCRQQQGREIEASIPRITRANPFGPMNSMLGPEGERWLPVHGLFPHSGIQQGFAAIQAVFDQHAQACAELGVGIGYLFATVSTHCFVLEPVFFWPDELYPLHEQAVEAAHLARLPRHQANPAAAALVARMRAEAITRFSELGAVHLQIGKSYHYREGLREEAWQLVKALKQVVDPQGRINPGCLGLAED